MKKIYSFIAVGFFALCMSVYSIQSNGKMTSTEQANALMLSDDAYQTNATSFECCSDCEGRFCGIFIHETGDTLPVNYYN